jgi:hypothetical protein
MLRIQFASRKSFVNRYLRAARFKARLVAKGYSQREGVATLHCSYLLFMEKGTWSFFLHREK